MDTDIPPQGDQPLNPDEPQATEALTDKIDKLSLEEQKTSKEERTDDQETNQEDTEKTEKKRTRSDDSKPKKKEKTDEDYLNLLFYQNKIKSLPRGTYIEDMHKNWWGDYDRLEDDHAYIQWLFPNFYQSNFNAYAPKLEQYEAEKFRKDPDIAQRLVKSYEMILDFYGMKLVDKKTGDLERSKDYLPRYKDALLTYFHNHLRIRRILTHLNNAGFRRYAVKLVDFLEQEIYGEVGGFNKYETRAQDFNKEALSQAPLRKLAPRNVFETWSIYGNHYDDPKRIALLEKNCFTKYPDGFVDSVYFEA